MRGGGGSGDRSGPWGPSTSAGPTVGGRGAAWLPPGPVPTSHGVLGPGHPASVWGTLSPGGLARAPKATRPHPSLTYPLRASSCLHTSLFSPGALTVPGSGSRLLEPVGPPSGHCPFRPQTRQPSSPSGWPASALRHPPPGCPCSPCVVPATPSLGSRKPAPQPLPCCLLVPVCFLATPWCPMMLGTCLSPGEIIRSSDLSHGWGRGDQGHPAGERARPWS